MIHVVVPVVPLGAAPLSHHSREDTSEVAHEDVKALGVSLKCSTLASLNHPGMGSVAHSMLKVHYIHSMSVFNSVQLQQVPIRCLALKLLVLDSLCLNDFVDAPFISTEPNQVLGYAQTICKSRFCCVEQRKQTTS